MEMEQLKESFRSQGWTVHMHKRRKLEYVYASRREGKKIKKVYFAPKSKTDLMTKEEVLEKLELIKK